MDKYEWITAKNNLMYNINSRQTICETLRLLYDEVHKMKDGTEKERLTEGLIEAIHIGKKMQDRLKYYQEKYKDGTGSKAKSLRKLPGTAERKKIRDSRLGET